ncbi:MAG: hypothetical protein JWO74_2780 [Solirubrobacterales bacterium]|nr:hypothetical protein [Solirubrobacterales bacterium]
MAYDPTPEQREILAHEPDRHGRVLAGPGTGKSATVVSLVTQLLAQPDPPRIGLLTFTRAATAELAAKVAAHEAQVERPSTIHSFAIAALLANPGSADFPSPLRVADDWEQKEIIRPHLASLIALPGVTPDFIKKRLLPEMAAMWESLSPDPDPAVEEHVRNRFLGAYEQQRRVFGYTLLGELPDLLRRAVEAHQDLDGLDFRLLIVDEYQDLNACDLRVIRLLGDRGVAVFAVGDDEQSIYGFRKAHPAGIRRFLDDYEDAADYSLSVSHRCGADIIAWARHVIEGDPERAIDRPRLTAADGAAAGETAMLVFPSQVTEARGVGDLVEHLINDEGLDPSDILIMSRGDHNGNFSAPIKEVLAERGIQVDDPSWVDAVVAAPENRTVLLLARLLADRNDSLAWAGLLCLADGIGPTFRMAIYDTAVARGVRFADALLQSYDEEFPKAGGAARTRALDLIGRTLAWLDEHPPPDDTAGNGWGAWMTAAFSGEDSPAAVSDELAELLSVIDDAVEADAGLARYLSQLQPLGRDHAQAQASGVRFMSLAMSKGLTVEASIIIGAEEGILPDHRADEAEERRLLYVGLTRARRFSYVTWAGRRTGPTARSGDGRVQERRTESRFLRNGPVRTKQGQDYLRTRWS